MIKINQLLFLLLFLSSYIFVAQTTIISGNIVNKNDADNIHVLNKSSHYNTITDLNGNFSIKTKLNDTLIFSSIQYKLKVVIIDELIYASKFLSLRLEKNVNELDEVLIGNHLTGNLENDLKNIETKKRLNFEDVGIPGFKGIPEEKIAPVVPYLGLASAVDVEALYKHLSGYYKKLRLKRKWEGQNRDVVKIVSFYSSQFFLEAYNIPKNRLYDFLLFCVETTDIQKNFKATNYVLVLEAFKEKSLIYLSRMENKE